MCELNDFPCLATAAVVWEFVARNWALMGIATTLILLVVIPAAILRKYAHIALNLMDDFAPPVWPGSREAAIPGVDSVDFSAFDGHTLRGAMLSADPDVANRGAIIFAHEFGMDRWSCSRYAEPLRAAGYHVFTFDFRGHGESPPEEGYKPRQFPSDREQADMLGAIAHVEDYLERRGRPREVGLFGLSRGGGAAILASIDIDSVKAIAVDGAFSSDAVMEYLVKRWANIFAKLRFAYQNHPVTVWRLLRWIILVKAERKFGARYPSVRKALNRISGKPILFIHGERDTYIPLEQTQMLYGLAKHPKYLWTVPGARHNQSVMQQPEEYGRTIVDFFNRHLSGDRTTSADSATAMSDLVQPVDDSHPLAVDRTQHRVR